VVLLDTHVWLWAAEGDTRRVGRRTRQLIAREARAASVRISPASIFEVAALQALGRLQLSLPVEAWIRETLDAMSVRVAPLSPGVAIDAGAIPREALADPFDRLLVATARRDEATMITADARILHYAADTSAVRVHDART
jgi:PIN domain nuclease of toxin-antitoxin system